MGGQYHDPSRRRADFHVLGMVIVGTAAGIVICWRGSLEGSAPLALAGFRLAAAGVGVVDCTDLPTVQTNWRMMMMFSFVRALRFVVVAAAAVMVLVGASSQSHAQSGTVRLHIVKAGFIFGVGGGNGTLNYRGRTYRFSVGGIGVGSLGVAAVDLVGTASNLRNPADIAGTYVAAGAGGAFVAGAQAATLQNERGVVLRVRGVQVGFQVSLGLAGMTIAMR